MPKTILFILLLVASCGAQAAVTAPATAGRVLILDNSCMPLPAAKATLIIGPLTRTNGLYVGEFKLKIFPYFFKNDHGRLAIEVPDQKLAEVNQGKPVAVSGTATSAKNGVVRHVEITATPQDCDHGTVNLWFMAGKLKMVFTPTYHFLNNGSSTALTPEAPLKICLR